MHISSNRVFGCTNRVYYSETITHPSVNAQYITIYSAYFCPCYYIYCCYTYTWAGCIGVFVAPWQLSGGY